MWKEKINVIRDLLVKHSKIAFPVIVVAAVAITVALALNAGENKKIAEEESTSESSEASTEVVIDEVSKDAPLVLNEDGAINTLILTFYNALALGDAETLNSLCDGIPEKDMLYNLEMAKYINYYPTIEIYTKAGLNPGDTIAYVYYHIVFDKHEESLPGYKAYYICTNEQGERYIKFSESSEEEEAYIKEVSSQDDLVEFNNRINVEYSEIIDANPELDAYLKALGSQVKTAVGVALAQQEAQTGEGTQPGQETQNGENPPEGNGTTEGEGDGQVVDQQPVESGPQYATATTTVNVRGSDSEQADKLGKVAGGTKIQVLEQRVNGWTKVLFEGKEGYIKSEYLEMAESAEGVETIGTVTAVMNVNVRAAASESAEKLGVLVGGDTVDLIAKENGWCKVKYSGQIGYVKADYVQ